MPQYSPQMGDKVMYFPQGHIQWLQAFQESSSPPWMSFPQKWPIVECEVRDVKFVFPDTPQEYKMCCSVKAKVTLAVVRVPLRHAITAQGQYVLEMVAPRATRHSTGKEITFSVTLRDWDMPDFLIPSDLFMRSIRLAWHTGVRVQVQFKDYSEEEKRYVFKTYYGNVEGMNNASAEWPHSPWDCIQVNWEDAESGSADAATRVGPWEAVPQYDASTTYARTLAEFPLAKLDEAEAQRILSAIDAVMDDPKHRDLFQPFAYEVDSSVFPSYYGAIPVPVCVELIRQRLSNGYYRQVESLEYDINIMHENCVNYNYDESEIVQASRQLRKRLLAITRPSGSAGEGQGAEGASSSESMYWADPNEPEPALSFKIQGRGRSSRQNQPNDSLMHMGASPSKAASQERIDTGHGQQSRTRRGGISSTEPLVSDSILRIKRHRDEGSSAAVGAEHPPARSRRNDALAAAALPASARSLRHRDSGTAPAAEARSSSRSALGRRGRSGSENAAESRPTRGASAQAHGARGKGRVNYAESASEDMEESESNQSDSAGSEESPQARKSGKRPQRSEARGNRSATKGTASRARRANRRIVRSASGSGSGSNSGESSEDDGSGSEESGSKPSSSEGEQPAKRTRRIVKAPANFAAEMAASMQQEQHRSQAQRAARRLRHQESSEESAEEPEVVTRSSRVVKAPPNYADEMAATMREERRNQALRSVRRTEVLRSPDAAQTSRNSGRVNPSQRYQEEQTRLAAERANQRARHSGPAVATQDASARSSSRHPPSQAHHAAAPVHSSSSSTDPARSGSRRLDPEVKRAMLEVLDYADGLDTEYGLFAQAVTEDIAPGYFQIVLHPVDLHSLREGVHKRQFESVEDVVREVLQMYENCALYNDETSLLGLEASRQRRDFQKFCRRHHYG